MARGFNLKWLGRRGIWASTGASNDRMARPLPARTGSLRPLPRCESTDEVDELAERWVIDDLDPLRHVEHTIR